ncbi:MAG TPA: hypothetical protein VGM36_02340 [Rhizomicrobium sp.]|jgi:hypothetical protein
MRSLSAKSAVTALLIALWLAMLALNWPGHLSTDSVIQLLEGRTGHYETWHPPVMSWLLGLSDAASGGAGLFAAFNITLLYAALLLIVHARTRISWLALPILLLCALTPQFLVYQGIVWKDVLFTDATIAGFACMAFAAARWQQRSLRFSFIAIAAILLSLAALTRQNGIVVSLIAAPALGVIAHMQHRRARTTLAYGFAVFAALVAITLAATTALQIRADNGKGRRDEIKMLQLYDLSGATARDPSLPLEILHQGDPGFEKLIRRYGASRFTPQRVDTLQSFPLLENARAAAPASVMMAQWRNLIASHPMLYLKIRAEIFRWTFLTPDIDKCVPFIVGFTGPPATLSALHIAPRYDDRDAALENYVQPFVHTPIFSHATFAVLAAIMFLILLLRRSPADVAIAFLLAGTAAFTLTFFAISLACDYRYLYLLDMAAMIALFHVACGFSIREQPAVS